MRSYPHNFCAEPATDPPTKMIWVRHVSEGGAGSLYMCKNKPIYRRVYFEALPGLLKAQIGRFRFCRRSVNHSRNHNESETTCHFSMRQDLKIGADLPIRN